MKTLHILTLIIGLGSTCQAVSPAPLKLFPPTTPGHSGAAAGTAVATSEKYVAVGAPLDGVDFPNGGAVHVFDAVSGVNAVLGDRFILVGEPIPIIRISVAARFEDFWKYGGSAEGGAGGMAMACSPFVKMVSPSGRRGVGFPKKMV